MLNRFVVRSLIVLSLIAFVTIPAAAQHAHGNKTAPPKVFLDKSPKVVEYQLSRLSNEQLLMIETDANDAKFRPVFSAILAREGMDKASRVSALKGLVSLSKQSPVDQLVETLLSLKKKDSSYQRVVKSLSEILIDNLPEKIDVSKDGLLKLIGDQAELAEVGYAALASRDASFAIQTATDRGHLAWLFRGVSLIPSVRARDPFRDIALRSACDVAAVVELRRSALQALAAMQAEATSVTFEAVSKLLDSASLNAELQAEVVRTLLAVMPKSAPAASGERLMQWIVGVAESSPADFRATDAFLDIMQLAEKVLPSIDSGSAKNYRQKLAKASVRIVRIKTVEEQMRYDTPYFAVQAGSELQIVLSNVDIMPHNLVITKPDGLKEVALASANAGPEIGPSGKQYVAQDDRVLFATNMVPAMEQERLTLKAPNQPGEYPYVCTYPGHWMRMYGVMIVVEDLDAWTQNPTKPKDPVGNNRQFVKNWTMDDFASDVSAELRGRSMEIGKRLFAEATCASCHKAGEDYQTGNIGPDLSPTLNKWKGDQSRVLREIIEPSYHIEPAYAMHIVLTDAGKTVSGVLVEENEKSISLLESVQAKGPTIIERESIEAHQKSSNSMMPKGLLDQYSRDEVLEILNYVVSIQKK